jgi:hypothetical protein
MEINIVKNRMIRTLITTAALCILVSDTLAAETRPNILFCISGDQSYAHTGATGDPMVPRLYYDSKLHHAVAA